MRGLKPGTFVGRGLRLTDLDDPSSWTKDRWMEVPVTVEQWTDLHGDDGGAYVGALKDYKERYQALLGIKDPSAAAGDYVMVSVDKGRTWSRPAKIAEPLTVGYTLLAPTGPNTCLVLSRRIVIEGQSRADVIQKWRKEWHDWVDKSGAVIEAREITVTRGR
jgi:hypothetical protein